MNQEHLLKPLSTFYFVLIKNLFLPSQEVKFRGYYVPNNFKEIDGKLNSLFQRYHHANSKDLILFILETFHEELNFIKQNMNMNSNIDSSNEQLV